MPRRLMFTAVIMLFLVGIICMDKRSDFNIDGLLNMSWMQKDNESYRQPPERDSIASIYLVEMQKLEDLTAKKECRAVENITELYCEYGFDLPIETALSNRLFSGVLIRPSASEMEMKLREMMDTNDDNSEQSIERKYYAMQRQIIEFESMPVDKNQLIRMELQSGLDIMQIRDLIASLVKMKKERNEPIDASELIRIKQFYEFLPKPEYRLEDVVLKKVRQAYTDLLVELDYSYDEISHRLIAFDENQMKLLQKSIPFKIKTWRDLQLSELQIAESMRAERNKTEPANIFQEWQNGLHYFPEIPIHLKFSSIRPRNMATQAINNSLIRRLNQLGISDQNY